MSEDSSRGELKRGIGLTGMVFYGVGTMIGGGFYALLGKIVASAGIFTPLSLALAGALALLSAFSFAELSRSYPVSAGEVQYVDAAFGLSRLSQLVGLLVVLTGVVSAATLCAATGGFLHDLTGAPPAILAGMTALLLAGVAAWGISQSLVVVAAITLLETGTLLLIILLSVDSFGHVPALVGQMKASAAQFDAAAMLAASLLAFYAFIGFEDMVNMAEETRNVKRTLPRAIFIAMAITIILYMGVALVAMDLEDREALARANTPLALLLPTGAASGLAIGVISILAGLNGALVQVVMAARVLYGMAGKGLAPAWFARVHQRTRTPLRATLFAAGIILVLLTSFSLTALAATTSVIILLVFALVNLSLARLRWREHRQSSWLPAIAALSCLALLLARLLL